MTEVQDKATTAAMLMNGHSIENWSVAALSALPQRLDDQTMEALARFSASPIAAPEPSDREHFAQCLRYMRASLPRRDADDLAADLMVTAYRRMLGHLSREASNFVSEQALARCDWFPTIAECLRIAAEWIPPTNPDASARQLAGGLIARENGIRFDDAMEALSARKLDQAAIDALPERWKRIASERMWLWAMPDGGFVVRVHGELPPGYQEQPSAKREPRKVRIPADGPRSAVELLARMEAAEVAK